MDVWHQRAVRWPWRSVAVVGLAAVAQAREQGQAGAQTGTIQAQQAEIARLKEQRLAALK